MNEEVKTNNLIFCKKESKKSKVYIPIDFFCLV